MNTTLGTRAIALAAASAATLTACGSVDSQVFGGPVDAQRTIEVSMTDMAFTPGTVDVEPGETVTFVFRNDGAVRHEAVIGDLAEQEDHHAEMAEMDGDHGEMDMGSAPHDMTDLHVAVVEPGETVELVHTFDTGSTLIGCHEPGHWEAGMRMEIEA